MADAVLFTHGVASGDPTTDGAVLWTRAVSPEGAANTLECVVVDASGREVVRKNVATDPERDHTVRVVVGDLDAGSEYEYWFGAGSRESRHGRFRTIRTDGGPLRFAVVSCAKYTVGYFNSYRHIADRGDLDFVLHLGDYVYEGANDPPEADIGRFYEPTEECLTVDDYRLRYSHYRRDPDLQDLHARYAIIAMNDDHEIANDAWSGGSASHREELHGPWSDRVRAAFTAWEDWIPSRARPVSENRPIPRRIDLGSLGSIVLTDARTHRSAPTASLVERTQFGREQLAWIEEQVAIHSGSWFIFCCSTTMSPLWSAELPPSVVEAFRGLKVVERYSGVPTVDCWDHFSSERDAIAALLDRADGSPLVLSGGTHVSFALDLIAEGRAVAREWTTPSVTSQNLDEKHAEDPEWNSARAVREIESIRDNVRYCELEGHGYMVVELGPASARGEWWHVETVLARSSRATHVHTDEVAATG